MNLTLDKMNANASFIETFMREHPIVFAWILGTLAGWAALTFARFFITSGKNRQKKLIAIDFAAAASVAGVMMVGHVAWQALICLSLVLGAANPALYWILSGVLIRFVPKAEKYLTLKELGPTQRKPQDDGNINSGEGQ